MLPSARLYGCNRCRSLVIICRRCDRGHLYCPGGCATQARRESLRRAGARYRRTPQGRRNNAARQSRFRARKRKKVTHQGSLPLVALALLLLALTTRESAAELNRTASPAGIYCHLCHRPCDPFLRNRFLRPSERMPPRPTT